MKTKKEILKKCMGKGGCDGKGGIVGDTIKEIPGTVVRGLKGIGKGIKKGIEWAGGQIEKDIKIDKAKDDKRREEGEDMMKGREKYKAAKKAILKKAITPENFPTKSKKNTYGEIINPTKRDVRRFNREFTTTY